MFAAGADISEMAEASPVEMMARNLQKYWRTIMDCPKPVIAAIEGFALGGGLELALCADIIVAGEGARLGLPEVKLGILAGGGGTQKLARLIGSKRAMLLLLTGRIFGAAEAHAMGVVSETAPAGQSLKRAIEIASEISAQPPIAVMQIKEIVNAGLNAPLDTALMLERRAFNCNSPPSIKWKACGPSWKNANRPSKGSEGGARPRAGRSDRRGDRRRHHGARHRPGLRASRHDGAAVRTRGKARHPRWWRRYLDDLWGAVSVPVRRVDGQLD